MIVPPTPSDESTRLSALRELGLLDTEAEERFDRITRLAKRLFDVPIALVSLVDANRQWFKSRQGLEASETPREISFCGHAIVDDEPLVITDARRDVRFRDNPLVTDAPDIRFYAGRPLRTADGHAVGTLCLIDRAPRAMDAEELELLEDLARMVEDNLAALDLATTDELTGLSNRRGFTLLADKALKTCRRLDRPATVVVIDLDGFKPINDRWGHAEGDRALKEFSAALLNTFRDSDVVGRLGGDEFGVFLGGADDETLAQCLERLNGACERVERPYPIAYSVGSFACRPDESAALGQMLAQADASMYRDKAGRGGIKLEPRSDFIDRALEQSESDVGRIATAIWSPE